jgi:sulfatase modifying factor 1
MEHELPITVPVPGGRFRMGSAAGRADEQPVRDVAVGAFALARTPVTRRQYAAFLATGVVALPPWWTHPAHADPDVPVVGVSWDDAVRYAEWLSATSGERWRLPHEAEWERAARGGRDAGRTAWGDDVPPGEIPAGPIDGPWPAGRGTPNAYGLCDMGTIVHEWCADWYDAQWYARAGAEVHGPATGERRASRGGSWRHRVRWSGPAARSSLPPAFRYEDYGFRVLREDA